TMDHPYYPKYAMTAAAAVDGTSDKFVVDGHTAAAALLPEIANELHGLRAIPVEQRLAARLDRYRRIGL
ncbi:MAG: hypothetical protein QOF67_1708, partial [Mycobacterium sp.]|nr:hypothetical protein [Mycobacterium sp.]